MKFIVILIVLTSLISSTFSAEKLSQTKNYILNSKFLNNGNKRFEIDLNLDKKTDRIETYKNQNLIAVERDSNFNGKIDEWITYSPYTSDKAPIEVHEFSTKGNSKIDRIKKIFNNFENNFSVISTEVDSSHDGKFNKKWITITKLTEQKEEISCENNQTLDTVEFFKLEDEVKSINQTLNQQYYTTDMGYKIHQSCLTNWGEDNFPDLLNKAMSKGFQCLEKLAKDNSTNNPNISNGAENNLNGLNHILQNSGVTIICNQTNYKWTNVAAHASTSPGDMIKELGVQHPFISIKHSYPKLLSKPTAVENSDLMITLFHEQLHNLGFRHGEDIEFAYACETCCMVDNTEEKTKDACKICAGAYSGATDKNYLLDLIAWGKSSKQSERTAKSIVKFQKEFPEDRFGLFAYAAAAGDINSPVGVEMGKMLKQKFSPLTSQEESLIKASQQYLDKPTFKKTADYSKVISEVHITLYYEQDTNKALDLLEKNNKELKKILALIKIAQYDDSFIYNNIKNKVFDLLVDIWMKGYPETDNPENQRAKKILQESGLLKTR